MCVFFGLRQISAVINNGQRSGIESSITNGTTNNSDNNGNNVTDIDSKNIDGSIVTDSVADSSEQESNRREAPSGLSDSYGVPLPSGSYGAPPQDSYVPPAPSNLGLPVPVYGVPDSPTNNIVYPAPPPDIPPPPAYGPPANPQIQPSLSLPPPKYGPPPAFSRPSKPFFNPHINVPKPVYGPPRPQYGVPIKPFYAPFKSPKPNYGVPLKLPKPHYGPPKGVYLPPKPSNSYGPPSEFLKVPKDVYGPPKDIYGPPKDVYGPPKDVYGPPKDIYGPPKNHYGPPKGVYGPPPNIQYGPPQPVPHGPPHPGAPAPPTPPDIKYDGWQPIPGLVSRPPQKGFVNNHNLQYNTDLVPPPLTLHGQSSTVLGGYNLINGVSDSYGAPLNTITGSGGIISTSGDAHGNLGHSHHLDASVNSVNVATQGQDDLSVIKSIGYEILHSNNGNLGLGLTNNGGISDSYGAPPLNSYSPDGPYAAAHSYKNNELSSISSVDNFASSLSSSFEATLSGSNNAFGNSLSSGVGLIPPSGVYGVPPSGSYGTPLPQLSTNYRPPELNLNQPKHPVVFREPVPQGLIESIGNSVAQKDAHGIIENIQNNYAHSAYVPPPVPDVAKHIKDEPAAPSTLYSLPIKSPTSFQTFVHGSSSAGLATDISSYNINNAATSALGGYSGNGFLDGSYTLPYTGTFTNSHNADSLLGNSAGLSYNFAGTGLSNSYGVPYFGNYQNYQNVAHDCSQKSQALPPLSFGVPAANSYSASLASLNTNIAGAYQGPLPALNYGTPDLQTAYSQSSSIVSNSSSNTLEQESGHSEINAKSFGENYVPGGELIQSQSLDLNNIPLKGNLGSYTLQIQSADGAGGIASVPHDQVLNDGLLQSILNAIEQPQKNTATILGQPLLHLQRIPDQIQQTISTHNEQNYAALEDLDDPQSLSKNIVVTPPPLDGPDSIGNNIFSASTQQSNINQEGRIPLIDNNEIALYYNNNANVGNSRESIIDETHLSKDIDRTDIRNAQQYGSYVSFRNNNSSYAYEDYKSSNVIPEETQKVSELKA